MHISHRAIIRTSMPRPRHIIIAAIILLVALAITGCVSIRETPPEQTARAQLMLSRAADRASAKIRPHVPKDNAIYIDTRYFPDNSQYRTDYALARIRSRLLAQGYQLVDTPDKADTIAEVSAGALSIDQSEITYGLPGIPIPIPFAQNVKTPEIALFKKNKRSGVAKFLVSFYSADGGYPQDIVGPVYGFSYFGRSSILGLGWQHQNLLPPTAVDARNSMTAADEQDD